MDYKFDTLAVHAGYEPDGTGAQTAPIYMTSAYAFKSTEHARALFALEQPGNIYTRLQNPTNDVLEARAAALDGGVGALAAASGHSAMVMLFLNLAQQGDEFVSASGIYGGAVNLMTKTFGQMGIKFNLVDAHDPENIRRAINERTRGVFVETMGNPLGDVVDIEAIAAVAHEAGVPLICDNTVATPALLRPIEHGADIVVYSSTKYLSGTGTVMGGIVVDSGNFRWKGNPRFPQYNQPDASYHGVVYADAFGKAAFITKLRTHILRDVGACPSPFNSWVTMLGMETLSLRMQRHSESGLKVAKFLENHPMVTSVSYPGLESSKYYPLVKKYLPKGASSMFCFDIDGSRRRAGAFCDSLKLLKIITNLGDSRTIVSCPAATTHSQVPDDELQKIGIKPGTIRISVGLEDPEDIIADIAQAFDEAAKVQ